MTRIGAPDLNIDVTVSQHALRPTVWEGKTEKGLGKKRWPTEHVGLVRAASEYVGALVNIMAMMQVSQREWSMGTSELMMATLEELEFPAVLASVAVDDGGEADDGKSDAGGDGGGDDEEKKEEVSMAGQARKMTAVYERQRTTCRRFLDTYALKRATTMKTKKMRKYVAEETIRPMPFTPFGLEGAGNGGCTPFSEGCTEADVLKAMFKRAGRSPAVHLRNSYRRQVAIHFLRMQSQAVLIASKRFVHWRSKAERLGAVADDAAWFEE